MNIHIELAATYTVSLLEVDCLRPTEKINIDRAQSLSDLISTEGRWTAPILIEQRDFLVMDGHHRLFCAKDLGLSFIPCVLLSYRDSNLRVTSWSSPEPFNVDLIVDAGLSGDLLGFKTTKHKLHGPRPVCSIPLEQLV